ncbi:MAG: MBL fold metallo-hydrolase [Gemmatimonadaceae bacterium]
MIYLARTSAGVIVIDLGWIGAEATLRKELEELVADAGDIAAVFLTHAHRDHIGGWRAVRGAPFVVAAPEAGFLVGTGVHADVFSQLAEGLLGQVGPAPDEVDVQTFSADTAFVFGADTLRAFVVPGHTPGSAAYLFREVLFVGDAMYGRWDGTITAPRRIFTTDQALAVASITSLQQRIAPYRIRWVCTAHSRCAKYRKAR